MQFLSLFLSPPSLPPPSLSLSPSPFQVSGVSFSPDGQLLATSGGGALMIWSLSTWDTVVQYNTRQVITLNSLCVKL